MMMYFFIAVALAPVLMILFAPLLLNSWRKREERLAIESFRLERERLEAKFFDLASGLGKPRGLAWTRCDWLDSVTFARAADTKLITAFAGINIGFEAVEGGDMEDVEAVSTIRDASAVFHYQNGRWGTGGRALFNMNPESALEMLVGQFEPISVVNEPPELSRQ